MKARKSSGNVFRDIGFPAMEAEELAVKSDLIAALAYTIERRGLNQIDAAALCGIDQPTLSKALRGRLVSVTIDRLAKWMVALGATVEITVTPSKRGKKMDRGALYVQVG